MITAMKPVEILAELKKKGIRIRAEKGELKYQAPRGSLTPAFLEQLKASKGELIALLEKMAAPVPGEPDTGGETPETEPVLPLHWKGDAFPAQKILDITIQREITTYLHRSLPLCVLLNDKRYLPWYYTRFMRIFSFVNAGGLTELNYLEPFDGCQEVMDLITLGFNFFSPDDLLLPFIIEKINLGYYLIINVDEYYLAAKQSCRQHHFVHASLIYGYDRDKQELLGIGFNRYRLFEELRFTFREFHTAWQAAREHYPETAPWCAWSAIQLLKPGTNPAEYPFDAERFMRELAGYLFSRPEATRLYQLGYTPENVRYGFAVYDVVAACLTDLLEGKLCIDYRAIHLLAEHKQVIYTRLEYVGSRYRLEGKFPLLLAEYRGFAGEYNKLRIALIKTIIEPLSLNQEYILTESLKEVIRNLRKDILSLKKREYALLAAIYGFLERPLLEQQTGKAIKGDG